MSTSKLTNIQCRAILNTLKWQWQWRGSVVTVNTHLAIWMKPQEAAACRGVQPSLSPLLTSLPLSTRNCTISAFSSMQACQRTHNHMMDCYISVYCLSFTVRIPTTHITTQKPDSTRQSEPSFSTVEKVFDPLHFGLLWKSKLQSFPKSIKFS